MRYRIQFICTDCSWEAVGEAENSPIIFLVSGGLCYIDKNHTVKVEITEEEEQSG